MKKLFLLLAASPVLCLSASAQISFIPKAGVTFSSISFDAEDVTKRTKLGLVVGTGFNFPIIKDFLSIQPELLYIQKGIAYKTDVPVRE